MTTEKRCVRCKIVKPVTEFYVRARTYRYAGRVLAPMSLCIECCKMATAARYKHRRPTIPEGMKWCGRCKSVKTKADFGSNAARADGLQNYCRVCLTPYQRKTYKRHREVFYGAARKTTPKALRRKASAYVSLAIFFGDLIPKPCEACGGVEVQAHHADYQRPLAVTWLCRGCHGRVHGGHFTGPRAYRAEG